MEKEFRIENYLNMKFAQNKGDQEGRREKFFSVCRCVGSEFDKEWKETDDETKKRRLEREKRAIMGYPGETCYYKERIKEILRDKNLLAAWYPPWYPDLTEGVFAELYGLSGLAPWAYDMTEEYRGSSSAKLIGERLYCLIGGRSVLQPQRIPRRRREQLKRTLLLASPRERLEYGFHEVYLHNGIRITIYSGDRTKEDQDVMVFRKYIVKNLTLGAIADRGTIPKEAVELFTRMIEIGFNVIFTGEIRSGKTTFLQAWQCREKKELEGLVIATDPETPWHLIMPRAPIMQLIADGKELEAITRSLLRGDNDYVLLEEMRDAAAFRTALEITSIGTRRCKATIHDNSGVNVPYKMASKIVERYGGDVKEYIAQVYKNFDYAIELCQDPDNKAKKIMKGIVEYSYDIKKDQILVLRVCEFDFAEGKWRWNEEGGKAKLSKYPEERERILRMMGVLKGLSRDSPMENEESISPPYYKGGSR